MAAVKNAGVGAIQYILNAREEGGTFKDLTDFCERVDLRQVGKRTLESLVKVGGLDAFADNRNQLLEMLEQMVSFSADHHRAIEVGQMSMFGADSGVQDKIRLPNTEPIDTRTRLDWEKELLGFYVTDHPVDNILRRIEAGNALRTFQFLEMDSSHKDKGVSMVALISTIREIPTKKGDMMAVLTMEDKYGSLEVVLFPRTWEGYKHLVREQENDVVLIKGRFDLRNDRPQIIVEHVTTEFEVFVSETNGNHHTSAATYDEPPPFESAPPPPIDWDGYNGPSDVKPTTPTEEVTGNGYTAAVETTTTAPTVEANERPEYDSKIDWDTELDGDPHLSDSQSGEPKQRWDVVVYMQPDDDPEKNRRRLQRIHRQFVQFKGKDRFMIIVEKPEQAYRLEFPEQRTGYCEELHALLVEIVGEDNIEVFEDS
jgi:hypothetical protein